MKVALFCGPTISSSEALKRLPKATILGPAAQGDVYEAVLDGADAIGLVDGYFESVPSVWHKEVLWAISKGKHVLGAASMGALRACELAPFGMTGIGQIFEDYRDGILIDDDEVAIAHGPAELGYLSVSVAMVDIRATLGALRANGLLSIKASEEMLQHQKQLHFSDRGYTSLLSNFPKHANILESAEKIGLKNRDAHRLIDLLQDIDSVPRPSIKFDFQNTYHWLELVDQVHARRLARKEKSG